MQTRNYPMRKILLLGMFCFAFLGKVQSQTAEMPSNPEFKRFVFQANQQIVLKPYDSLYFDIEFVPGDNWVFKFDYKAKDVVAIADDEFSEMVIFQMKPVKGNSFKLSEAEFETAKVIYSRSCFCKDSGPRIIETGSISGKRIGKNKWLVTFELQINPRPGVKAEVFTKKFKGYFNPGALIY